jgi:uncharacterized membrane protein YebE (DUF533 family)
MTSFFEHQKLSFRKNYLRNLIQLASADGRLDESEIKVLYEIGKQRNLKDWQIDELLKDLTAVEIFIPESFLNKMNLLFDLMRLIYADGIVDENEIAYIRRILSAFNLSHNVIAELVEIFAKGTPSIEEWRDFTESLTVEIPEPKFLTIL